MAGWEPPNPEQLSYHIGGVKVLLPVKPYPCQLAMMGQIIRGLKHRQNCLLESPTGSGKSLALLCSTLAWQRHQTEIARLYNELVDQGVTDPDVLARAAGLPLLPPQATPAELTPPSTSALPSQPTSVPNPVDSGGGFFYEDDNDDFRRQESLFRVPQTLEDSLMDIEDFDPMTQNVPQKPHRLRVPKIFIGTRTHKQVEQIIKELRRTAYRDVRMVVLSSREHTCIHPVVSTSAYKNEKCQELNDPKAETVCGFYHGVNRIKTHEKLALSGGLQGAWDIEDLVRVGHKVHACPYFTARSLLTTAELVICPYNYLVDPLIKDSMEISLKNHVVVLDEAHNIEDASREAASCTVTQEDIREARNHLEQRETKKEDCEKLVGMLSALSNWIDGHNHDLSDYTEYGRSGKIFTGTEIIAHLDHLGIGRENYVELQRSFASLLEQSSEDDVVRLSPVAKKVLKDIFLVYHFLFMENMKFREDYRVALIKEQVRKKSGRKVDGWIARSVLELEYSINFWCLNPGVAFSPISNVTHNIILTSGTLSPMTSFQSELGVSFKIQLEANHVIDRNQIFVGSIGHGPRGKPLLATYQHAESWEFQDELGELVLNVCQTVPGGILCFLPSYSMLHKLHDRWQCTGIWDEISKVKEAMTEQRKGDEFERDMVHFYTTIRNAQMDGADGVTGVFFMAVYRGKVSEGLDFTDDNARAVIAVGIPFPNIKDIQVDLKKRYNNSLIQSRKLLSGKEWYEIQAYRAINQALGRCIRHRYDWGALLLVDLRFQRESLISGKQENHYVHGLSKWVRSKVVHHKNFTTAISSLGEFVRNMSANPPSPPQRHDVASLATPQETAGSEMNQSSLLREGTSASHKVINWAQPSSYEDQSTSKSLVKPLQNISTSEGLREKASDPQKECNDATSRQESSNTLGGEKSVLRHGSASCESGKENDRIYHQSRKRPHTAVDDLDLDDFNLVLSPSTSQANYSPSILRKKGGKKKGVQYTEIDY